MSYAHIKTFVRGAYDLQRLRIMHGNRLVAQFRSKLGLEPGEKEDTDKEAQKVLKALRVYYRNLTEGVVDQLPRRSQFVGNEVISTFTELCLVNSYLTLEEKEKDHFRLLEQLLSEIPVYTEYFKKVKGIGPALAGFMIAEIDIHKAKYPSSLWMYCGLDVAPDGRARGRYKEHLVEREYIDASGQTATKKSLTYNPNTKSKLLTVLGSCLLRSGNEQYSKIYQNYKNRLEHHVQHKDKTPMHKHRMANRYMVKRFLVDTYVAWRSIEGLPVSEEYAIAKLGYSHGQK